MLLKNNGSVLNSSPLQTAVLHRKNLRSFAALWTLMSSNGYVHFCYSWPLYMHHISVSNCIHWKHSKTSTPWECAFGDYTTGSTCCALKGSLHYQLRGQAMNEEYPILHHSRAHNVCYNHHSSWCHICHTTSHKSNCNPGNAHWIAAQCIIRYLYANRTRLLVLGGLKFTLTGWVDSDWGTCKDTCFSTSGYTFSLGLGLVSWSSKKTTKHHHIKHWSGIYSKLPWHKGGHLAAVSAEVFGICTGWCMYKLWQHRCEGDTMTRPLLLS